MVKVQLNDDAAAALSPKANAQGLMLDAYLEKLAAAKVPRKAVSLSVEELERLLDQESTFGPFPSGTFSRAEMYGDGCAIPLDRQPRINDNV